MGRHLCPLFVSVLTRSGFHFAATTALIYNAINSSIDGIRGQHDVWGSMGAGGLTGALYKSTGVSLSDLNLEILID